MKRLCDVLVRVKDHVCSRITLLFLSVMAAALKAAAQGQGQGQGSAGLNAAEAAVKSYFPPAINLMYAIGALMGIVGAVKV
ncbi:DUF4134 family protein [Filimonas effusa]|nr:DUF4134 family protein [Filimonas effusa]